MNLEFVKTSCCPTCGCDIVAEETVELNGDRKSIRRHSNGGAWEQRTFACGCRVSYCPNFRKEEITGKCVNDPKYIEMMRKRAAAKKVLYSAIKELDVDDTYRERLKNAVKFV